MTTPRILPVIVLYKCSLYDAKSYQTLLARNDFQQIVVYDNSPAAFHTPNYDSSQLIYHRNLSNGGVSAAYNYGMQKAEELDYERILLLDQDTEFAPDAWQAYQQGNSKIALWAPSLITQTKNFSPVNIRKWRPNGVSLTAGLHPLLHFAPVNSGMCIAVKAMRSVGGYDEDVFLDYADFVFCQRLAARHPYFQLLPTEAFQDFSNEGKSTASLIQRYGLYLKSVSHVDAPDFIGRLKLRYQILRHTFALLMRTRSWKIIRLFSRYLF